MQTLIETFVREDVLVKEALELSMDQGDAAIRRRLVQKMTFLTESAAGAQQFDDAAVMAFFEENQQDYASSPLLAFEQVHLGEVEAQVDVAAVLAALQQGQDPGTMGALTMLSPSLPLAPAQSVDGAFGRGFYDILDALEVNTWQGPVISGFGVHVVRVTEKRSGVVPKLDEIRSRVEKDLSDARASELAAKLFDQMQAAYVVDLPSEAELKEVIQ
jgi:hypothetical protein